MLALKRVEDRIRIPPCGDRIQRGKALRRSLASPFVVDLCAYSRCPRGLIHRWLLQPTVEDRTFKLSSRRVSGYGRYVESLTGGPWRGRSQNSTRCIAQSQLAVLMRCGLPGGARRNLESPSNATVRTARCRARSTRSGRAGHQEQASLPTGQVQRPGRNGGPVRKPGSFRMKW